MGKILIIKGADFSTVAVEQVEPMVGKFEQEVSLPEKVSWAVLFDPNESKLKAVEATTFDGYVIPVTTGEKYKITTSLQRYQPPVVSINSSSMSSSVIMSEILPYGSTTPSLWNRQEFIIPSGVTHIFIQQINNSYEPVPGGANFPITGYELKLWKVG